MSYDMEIWAVLEGTDVGAALPEAQKWIRRENSWVWDGGTWLVSIYGPDRVLEEDVPEEVRSHLPGIRTVYHLHLEPLGAPAPGTRLLKAAAKAIGQVVHGAIRDPQTDDVRLPSGIKRFTAVKRSKEERFDRISMGWWFTDSPLQSTDGVSALVDILERFLPEAMPRRYGLYEPPQHHYEETGREHFAAFLAAHPSETVWYPTRPVVGMSVNCRPNWGWEKNQGFRANHIDLQLDAAALAQPGWSPQLSRFWKETSRWLKPFYGEVRTLAGAIPSGGTYALDMKTEQGPTCGGWWRGVPRSPGYAVVLGAPYLALWPAFAMKAESMGGLAMLSLPRWEKEQSVTQDVGPVPEPIVQRWSPEWTNPRGHGWSMNWNTQYPPTFPFGEAPPGCLDRERLF